MSVTPITAHLINAVEVAARLKVSTSYLLRRGNRALLEANGFPPPRLARPLRWPSEAVERWIRTGSAAPELAVIEGAPPPAGTPDDWRSKLTAEYGGR